MFRVFVLYFKNNCRKIWKGSIFRRIFDLSNKQIKTKAMTLTKLQQRYAGKEFSGYGHYRVSFVVRGKLYSNVTTNMDAIERINMADEITDKTTYHRYTLKEAYQALYNEVMPPKSYNIKTTA